ncbi:Retrovirus-related Pol polyprotein from transposon RE2, partial [Bienertia sinuspersici]
SENNGQALVEGQCCLLSCNSLQWLLDSGATDHICCDLSKFTTYIACSTPYSSITIPNGHKVYVTHNGTIKMTKDILLNDVLYVLEYKFNLISVHKLCKDLGCELLFTSDKCLVQHPQGNTTLLGNLAAGLYTVADRCQVGSGEVFSLVNKPCLAAFNEAQLWHLRMGNFPFPLLKLVVPSC